MMRGHFRILFPLVSPGHLPPYVNGIGYIYILFSILKKNIKEVKIIHFGLYGVERGHFQDIDTTIWPYMGVARWAFPTFNPKENSSNAKY